MPRVSKKKPKTEFPAINARQYILLPPSKIACIHPSVPSQLCAELHFQINDLSDLTLAALELCLRSHAVGVSPADEKGKHHIITGLRVWQIYRSASERALIQHRLFSVYVHEEAVDPDRIQELATVDAFLSAELFSLSIANGYSQLRAIQSLISDDRWQEMYGQRPRLSERPPASRPSKPHSPNDAKRGPGRPPTRPPLDPNAPKRPRGRPPKVKPSVDDINLSSGDQGSDAQ